ncbi:hypothetical protein HHK36_033430 [Tetracentron sinense]|uniref:Uncharacterized protein n=1 Tax=Tetracentron sinense TaxID=13715 RepID=A0A834Y535_TETSI|nr:hypothetical protein HHK36_033430 [Tetracentron sinense]
MHMGFQGNPFTWSNMRVSFANVWERLDRALCSTEWRDSFPEGSVFHLPFIASDHCPLRLVLQPGGDRRSKGFKFEAMWIKEETSALVIKRAWKTHCPGSNMFRLCRMLNNRRMSSAKWNRDVFGNLHQRKAVLSSALANLQS